jgi:hypothetical protein
VDLQHNVNGQHHNTAASAQLAQQEGSHDAHAQQTHRAQSRRHVTARTNTDSWSSTIYA